MIDPVRQEVIALAQTIVVKVGTNVLAGSDGLLDGKRIQALADGVQRIRQTGRKVALVSSGAIGAGVGRLEPGKTPHRSAPSASLCRGRAKPSHAGL